jgi:hypothetical protein
MNVGMEWFIVYSRGESSRDRSDMLPSTRIIYANVLIIFIV